MATATAQHSNGSASNVGKSKVERYGWTVKDGRGVYMEIDKHAICVDHTYQRDLVENKVGEMVRAWSWMAFGCIIVVQRPDGSFFVSDGQHRLAGALRRSDITTVPCMVFQVLAVEEEASGFLKSNAHRKPMTMQEKFKAMLVCNDATAVAVQQVLDSLGLAVNRSGRPRSFNSLAWAVGAYKRAPGSFDLAMRLAARICGDRHGLPEPLCRGLFALQLKHGALNNDRFVRRVLHVGYSDLMDGAQRAAAYFKRGHDKAWSQGILDTLNHGLHKRFYVDDHKAEDQGDATN
jgi:hypothetical protein